MCIVKQGDKSFYFIHIPRTGGRYVKGMFENSSNIEIERFKNNQTTFYNICVLHLHYPLYLDYFSLNENDIPHIAIVRNPYDKFFSAIKYMHFLFGFDYKSFLNDKKRFLDFTSRQISFNSAHNNWFLPQHKFTSPKTHFWNYENGFGKKFTDWIFDITKIKIDLPDSNCEYRYLENEKKIKELDYKLDRDIEKYVKSFYKLDYIKFGYNL